MKKNVMLMFIIAILVSGCGGSPEPNVVSREDITDFCDAIPSSSDFNDQGDRDRDAARGLGATNEQAQLMSQGSAIARVRYAFDAVDMKKEKTWEQRCKTAVMSKL